MSVNQNAPLGVVIIARHGDRTGFYQNPTTYTASDTVLTPLGEQQNYQLGQMLNAIYAGNDSTRAIAGLSSTEMVGSQISSIADAGGEGSVIWDSAVALWQGFYPPRLDISNMTLANGSIVTSPLGGYQYVKVETVIPTDDVDFEPWTNCAAWTNRSSEVYASEQFVERGKVEDGFLQQIKESGIVGNRTVSMANFYNVFDYMNVNAIHDETYNNEVEALGNGTLAHARDLASFHEYALFTDSALDGLGNIAGRAILSRIISALQGFTEEDNNLLVQHYHVAYKPLSSLFNMTNVAAASNPTFEYPYAMVDYASVAVYEIRESSTAGEYDVRFGFKNGSSTATDVTYYPLFGSSSVDIPLSTFISNLNGSVIQNNTDWCTLCGNNGTVDTCSEWALTQQYEDLAEKYKSISDGHFTSVGSGFIGAAVTIVVMVAAIALFRALGWVQFGKKRQARGDRYPLNDQGSYKGSVATTA
ncbi:hypothetical protein JCM8547_005817 [Rhodosporidiobolus lusitaniae]